MFKLEFVEWCDGVMCLPFLGSMYSIFQGEGIIRYYVILDGK